MGATASSSRCEEEERTAGPRDAADDPQLHRNGQISSLSPTTKNPTDEVNGHFEERVLADVCSGFVTIKEDSTEMIEDLQDVVSHQPNTKNEGGDLITEDGVTVKDESLEVEEVNSIHEVGFKKVFRFVGFKFTLKKDTCEKAEGEETQENEQEEKVAVASGDSIENDTKEKNIVAATTPDELLKNEEPGQPEALEPSHKTEEETQLNQDTGIVEQQEFTPDKEQVNMTETSPETEQPMSPIKQFFIQGIFASLRKKKKDDEIQKESKEEELFITDKIKDAEMSEGDEKVDTKCMCLDIPYIMHEEDKDLEPKGSKILPEEELQCSIDKEMVQASPLKRLFRKFSSRKQTESKVGEHVIEAGDKVTEQPESSLDLTKIEKEEESVVRELRPAVEEQLADVSPQESKKKSDSIVSWEALICGSSAKKRARKTTEGDTEDNERTNESPLGSSIEADYDNFTSSNEHEGEGESGSTWQVFKKMVTPKRKVRTGESSSSENIPSEGEMNKDESFSMKKLIAGRKKRKSDGRQDQTSSDETGRDAETGDEDDETPAIIPLSEYEIIDPESVKEINEKQSEITIEHEIPDESSQGLEQDTTIDEAKLEDKVSNNAAPLIIRVQSEDFEEVTDFMSKYQQLSDIPEEGIIEESIETPESSSEWTTQDDTLAEDIVDLTADAVTAPEPASDQLIGDNSSEMVSALSQLTDSPTTSGHITPVSAEHSLQVSNMIFQEAVETICMTPSLQLVTTKDESQESLAVSFSPNIIKTTITEETKVLVAHMKTEATAICTGLISQEMEPVEGLISAPLVEAIPEVSDAILTEKVCHNHTDATEEAGLRTDEIYKAEIFDVKTELQDEFIANEEEATTETQVDVEQVIQNLGESLIEVAVESHVVDMLDKKIECLTEPENTFQLGSVEMQNEAVLDKVIPENTDLPQSESPLHSMLEEHPVHYSEVTSEVREDTADLEDKVHIDQVEVIHVDETQVVIVDAILLKAETKLDSVEVIPASDSKGSVVDGAKNEETGEETKTNELQGIRDTTEEHSLDMSLEVDQNIKNEQISETAAESFSIEELEEKQIDIGSTAISLLEKVRPAAEDNETSELDICPKEMDTDLDNIKEEESASEGMDSVTEKLAVNDTQLHINTKSDESENQKVCEITEQEVETSNLEKITGADVSEMTIDVLEHKEISQLSEDSQNCSKVMTDLESVGPLNEAKELNTDKWSDDIEHSSKTSKNEQMIGIIEKSNKQSENEEPVPKALMISELPNTTEEEDGVRNEIRVEAIDGEQNDQASVETAKEIKETDTPESEDKVSDVTKLEPESIQPTEIKVIVTAVSESVKMPQNNDAVQMENTVIAQKDEMTEKTRLKCESEQFPDKPLAMELQAEKTELKDEISSVKYLKEKVSTVTTPGEAPIVHAFEIKAETVSILQTPDPEVQTQEATELRAGMLEPNLESPEVAEVEPIVLTEMGLDTPVVTAVVTEFEVEEPVLTPMAEAIDTHDSVVTSLIQNKNIITSKLTTIVKNQDIEEPSVSSAIPATLNQDTSDVNLGSKSVKVALIGDTSEETPVVEELSVNPVVLAVEEMQTVISVVEPPTVSSVTVTETVPTAERTEIVITLPETSVGDPVLPTYVVSVPSLAADTSAMTPVLEMPNLYPVLQTATLDSTVEAPAVISVVETQSVVLVSGAERPVEGTPAEIQEAKTSVVSPVVETSVISSSSVVIAMAEALLVTPVDETSALVSATATEAMDPVEETLLENPQVETPAEMSSVHATPDVETPALDLTTQCQVVVLAGAETPIVYPEVELCTVNSIQFELTDDLIPVVQTPALVSVVVKEAAELVMPSVIAVVEESSVETTFNPSAMTNTQLTIPEVTTEEIAYPAVQLIDADDLIETSTGIPAPEALQVTPLMETPTETLEAVTTAVASKVVMLDVMPGVMETTLQMVEHKTKIETTVEAQDDVKPTAKTIQCISTEENSRGSLQQESVISSTESQSEVEDDVWEDAVDNIDDGASQMMKTSISPQENAVKNGSDAIV